MFVDVSAQKMMSNQKLGQKMIRSDNLIAFNTGNPLTPGRYDFENQILPNYPNLRWNVQKPKNSPSQPQNAQTTPQQYPIAPQPQYQAPTPIPYIPPQPQAAPIPQPQPHYQAPMPAPMAMPTPQPQTAPIPQAAPQPPHQGPNNTQLLIEAFEKGLENMANRICNSIGIWGQDISMKLDRNAKALDDSISFLLSKANDKELQAYQANQQQLAQKPAQAPVPSPPVDPNQTQFVNQTQQSSYDDEPI